MYMKEKLVFWNLALYLRRYGRRNSCSISSYNSKFLDGNNTSNSWSSTNNQRIPWGHHPSIYACIFSQFGASVHPIPPVQFLQRWKLLQGLGSSLTARSKQNARYATCWAFY